MAIYHFSIKTISGARKRRKPPKNFLDNTVELLRSYMLERNLFQNGKLDTLLLVNQRHTKLTRGGIFASRNKTKRLTLCRKLTGTRFTLKSETPAERMSRILGSDWNLCPKCKSGRFSPAYAEQPQPEISVKTARTMRYPLFFKEPPPVGWGSFCLAGLRD